MPHYVLYNKKIRLSSFHLISMGGEDPDPGEVVYFEVNLRYGLVDVRRDMMSLARSLTIKL